MLAMEKWSDEFEVRFKDYQDFIEQQKKDGDVRHQKVMTRIETDQEEARRQYRVNDLRDNVNKENLENQDNVNDIIDEQLVEVRELLENTTAKMQESFDDRLTRQQQHAEQTETHLNLQLEKANREIEKLKFELHDQLETKHE